ncbi:hypothetical protein EAH87_10405 [Sphingomonas koreensis]|nr:hypothetical protein EAH87_10405 [Sphingomonas koreensis]
MDRPNTGRRISTLSVEPQLFARRASIIFDPPNGAHVQFSCLDHDGHLFYCKPDADGRPLRAIELICTLLAESLGIRVADVAIIEHGGETYFGSRDEPSSENIFSVRSYLSTRQSDELGGGARFPGEHLARLFVLDVFLNNPDRGFCNFLLVRDGSVRRLCAIDFANADLSAITTDRMPVANSQTLIVGKQLRAIHGDFRSCGVEMLERIATFPADAYKRIVGQVPLDWLTAAQRKELNENWQSSGFANRLATLRKRLEDGELV